MQLSWPRLHNLAAPTPASVSPAHLSAIIGQPGPTFLYPQVGLPVGGGERRLWQAGTNPQGAQGSAVGPQPPGSSHTWNTTPESSHTWDAGGCKLQTAPPAGAEWRGRRGRVCVVGGVGRCLGDRTAAPAQKPQDARLPALGRGGGGRGPALQSGNSLKRVTRLRWEEIWPLGNRGSHSCFSLKMDSPSAEKALGSRRRCAAPVSCGEPCRHPDPQEPSLLPSRTQQGSLTSCSFREPLTSPRPALHAGEALSTSSKEAYFLYNSDCAKGLLKTDDAHIRTLSHSHYWWYVKKKLNLFGGDFDIYEFTIITPYVPTIFKFSLYDALKIFTTTLLHLLQF